LIAVGIFKLIGFNVVSNFNQPYNCSSFSDFWKRWNISLSNFFRDYLYIPLGGNRCSKFRNAFNILLVMFFAGIWHGSSILFIGWGLIHGCLLIIENLFIIKTINHKLLNFLRRIVTLFFIFLLWLPFKIIDPNIIESILKNSINYNSLNLFLIDGKLFFIKNILLILFIISIEFIFNKKNTYLLTKSNFYFFYIFMILFFIIITAKFNEQKFIYFQF
jgi:D-alanyl-lipoteichoic acid acyltransferase DltB (MBOAT superfamily)